MQLSKTPDSTGFLSKRSFNRRFQHLTSTAEIPVGHIWTCGRCKMVVGPSCLGGLLMKILIGAISFCVFPVGDLSCSKVIATKLTLWLHYTLGDQWFWQTFKSRSQRHRMIQALDCLQPAPSKFHRYAGAPSLQNDILIWRSIHQLHGHSCFLFASEFHVNIPDAILETKMKCFSMCKYV